VVPTPLAAGMRQSLTIDDPKHSITSARLQAFDGAGNAGYPTTLDRKELR
jgi:hypothetical protein